MRKLFILLGELLKNGESAVIVTVVASSGSTPRGAGAHMLITAKGLQYGTIGGGAVEYQSIQMAQDVLKAGISRIEHYMLHKNQMQDLGMICGGDVHVYFSYIPAGNAYYTELTEKIEEMYRKNEQAWLISEITLEVEGAIGIYGEKSGSFGIDAPPSLISSLKRKAAQIEKDGRVFYCEELVRAESVYIFGGGHVSQALVPVLAAVNFRCVILEDREDFCRPELFQGVEETLLIDNSRILEYIDVGKHDYAVILTRGHKDDQTVMAQVLKTPARYIGVIGSKRKSEAVFANLREMGFTDSELERIITPIGLEIGAETPAEIAVSITAQLIHVRSGH